MRNMRCIPWWSAWRPKVIARGAEDLQGRYPPTSTSTAASFTACWTCRWSCIPPFSPSARIAGWSAHRIEELINAGKIIRPAYKSVKPRVDYVPLHDRK